MVSPLSPAPGSCDPDCWAWLRSYLGLSVPMPSEDDTESLQGRQDLNLRPSVLETDALAELSYAPMASM